MRSLIIIACCFVLFVSLAVTVAGCGSGTESGIGGAGTISASQPAKPPMAAFIEARGSQRDWL